VAVGGFVLIPIFGLRDCSFCALMLEQIRCLCCCSVVALSAKRRLSLCSLASLSLCCLSGSGSDCMLGFSLSLIGTMVV